MHNNEMSTSILHPSNNTWGQTLLINSTDPLLTKKVLHALLLRNQ